jgi:NAD-dependent dihydropyrimidine dehydrogenase PreA subunit
MAYIIAEPCIGTKDAACVDACPVDCIHPKKDEAGFSDAQQLFIDPVECIDCGACVPVCPRSGPNTRTRTRSTLAGNAASFEHADAQPDGCAFCLAAA